MEIEQKNQNNNNFEDVMDLFEIDYVYENRPIKRSFDKSNSENKQLLLENLKKKILNISDCELKKNSNQIVFSDGDTDSPIMIIGEGPGQKEDEMGKPFVGDAGVLLNKMLDAINIKRPNGLIYSISKENLKIDLTYDSNKLNTFINNSHILLKITKFLKISKFFIS